jgi:hypothetical protein
VTNNNIVIFPQPLYSLDIAPWFCFVSHIENETEGTFWNCLTSKGICKHSIKENDFHGAFEAWKKWWDRCIRSQGDYFEGWQPKLRKLSQNFFFDQSGNFLISPHIVLPWNTVSKHKCSDVSIKIILNFKYPYISNCSELDPCSCITFLTGTTSGIRS